LGDGGTEDNGGRGWAKEGTNDKYQKTSQKLRMILEPDIKKHNKKPDKHRQTIREK